MSALRTFCWSHSFHAIDTWSHGEPDLTLNYNIEADLFIKTKGEGDIFSTSNYKKHMNQTTGSFWETFRDILKPHRLSLTLTRITSSSYHWMIDKIFHDVLTWQWLIKERTCHSMSVPVWTLGVNVAFQHENIWWWTGRRDLCFHLKLRPPHPPTLLCRAAGLSPDS